MPWTDDYERFTTGDRLSLIVEPKGEEGEPLYPTGHARPVWTQSSSDSHVVKVKAVKHVDPAVRSDEAWRRRQLDAADAFPPKDLISIRVTYSDVGGPDYCDYDCVEKNMCPPNPNAHSLTLTLTQPNPNPSPNPL